MFQKLSQYGETRKVKRLQDHVEAVNAFEPEIEQLTDAELRERTERFRERIADTREGLDEEEAKRATAEILDEILPEAFACVREAAKRTIGQRHYDVQLMGGVVLHHGDIAEMKTGEGKTLVSTLPTYLNSVSYTHLTLPTNREV